MSGGRYGYICWRINDFSDALALRDDPRRIAFKKLLKLVSEAAHDIEWVDSGDYGKGGDSDALDAVFAFLTASPNIIAKAHAYDEFKTMVSDFLGQK